MRGGSRRPRPGMWRTVWWRPRAVPARVPHYPGWSRAQTTSYHLRPSLTGSPSKRLWARRKGRRYGTALVDQESHWLVKSLPDVGSFQSILGRRGTLDGQKTLPRTNRAHLASGGDEAGRWSHDPEGRQGTRHKRSDLSPPEDRYGGMGSSEAKRLKELERENARLM